MTIHDDDDEADDLRDEEDPDESDTDDDAEDPEDDADWADPPRRPNLLWAIVVALVIVAMLVWALRGRW
jgi:hypothetical protein